MNIVRLTLLAGIAFSCSAALAQQAIVAPSPETRRGPTAAPSQGG